MAIVGTRPASQLLAEQHDSQGPPARWLPFDTGVRESKLYQAKNRAPFMSMHMISLKLHGIRPRAFDTGDRAAPLIAEWHVHKAHGRTPFGPRRLHRAAELLAEQHDRVDNAADLGMGTLLQ